MWLFDRMASLFNHDELIISTIRKAIVGFLKEALKRAEIPEVPYKLRVVGNDIEPSILNDLFHISLLVNSRKCQSYISGAFFIRACWSAP